MCLPPLRCYANLNLSGHMNTGSSESPGSDEFHVLKQAAELLLEIKTKKLGWSYPAAPDSRVN
jgi:hypothetical protein